MSESQNGVPKYRIQIDAHENRPDQPQGRGESLMVFTVWSGDDKAEMNLMLHRIRECGLVHFDIYDAMAQVWQCSRDQAKRRVLAEAFGIKDHPIPASQMFAERARIISDIGGAQSAHKSDSEA